MKAPTLVAITLPAIKKMRKEEKGDGKINQSTIMERDEDGNHKTADINTDTDTHTTVVTKLWN